eukprot:gene9288-6529_t
MPHLPLLHWLTIYFSLALHLSAWECCFLIHIFDFWAPRKSVATIESQQLGLPGRIERNGRPFNLVGLDDCQQATKRCSYIWDIVRYPYTGTSVNSRSSSYPQHGKGI